MRIEIQPHSFMPNGLTECQQKDTVILDCFTNEFSANLSSTLPSFVPIWDYFGLNCMIYLIREGRICHKAIVLHQRSDLLLC